MELRADEESLEDEVVMHARMQSELYILVEDLSVTMSFSWPTKRRGS
jgi:hypothetical protein